MTVTMVSMLTKPQAYTSAGYKWTGAAMNPARVIGPALVFLCTPQKDFWFYLLGEGIGAVLAGLWATATFKVAAGDTPGDGSENNYLTCHDTPSSIIAIRPLATRPATAVRHTFGRKLNEPMA